MLDDRPWAELSDWEKVQLWEQEQRIKEWNKMAFAYARWPDRAEQAARKILDVKGKLTSDDIHDAVGDPERPNQMGALFNLLREKGLIRPVGITKSKRNPAKHRNIQVWEKAAN
jgi:hypothetical protein